jgi:hypothetical protein
MIKVVSALPPEEALALLGYIPDFLDETDPRPAKEQIDDRYIGGWMPQPGWTIGPDGSFRYPGDPPMVPQVSIEFNGELLLLLRYSFLAIVQRDGSFEVARLD